MKPKHGFGRRGVKRAPEYAAWMDMRSRCFNQGNRFYPAYGGRGITICERWSEFANFLADMGHRPSALHSLDREAVNGPYDKANCRWVVREIQDNNKRDTRLITWRGATLSIAQWERRQSLTKGSLKHRLAKGWTLERSMTEPVQISRRRDLCAKGHPLGADNIFITCQGARLCRICHRERAAAYAQKMRARRRSA